VEKLVIIARSHWSKLFFTGILAALLCPLPCSSAQAPSPTGTAQAALTQSKDSTAPPSTDNFEELARKASAAREQDRTDEAIDLHQKALALRPDWIEGWWYIGTLYAATDQDDKAAAAFQKVVAAKPEFGPGWASLGLAQYEVANFLDAYKSLLRAHDLGFESAPQLEKTANYHLALLFNQNGRFEEAWELLASSLTKSDDPGQIKTALALAMLRVPLVPERVSPAKDALLDLAGEAALALVAGRLEQAVQLFRRMLRDYPDTPYLHYAYGSALDFHQRYEDAEQQLREQIHLTPRSAVAHLRLGAVLVKLHRPADALPIAQRAVELNAGSVIAHKLMARVLTDLGRVQDAVRETELANRPAGEAYAVDQNVANFYQAPITAKNLLGQNGVAGRTSFSNASPSFSDLAASAERERAAGHTEEAIRRYQEALKKNPDWVQGWKDLGILRYASGRYDDSTSALLNSLSLDRTQADAWVFLGLSEFQAKDYQNSYLHLERGRQLGFRGTDEAKRVATYYLAQLRNLNGDFEGALDLMASSLDSSQLTPSMKLVLGMSLLRVPNLVAQVDPSKTAMLEAVGETTALLRQQKYDDAFRGFDQLIQAYPDAPFLHYAYGSALQTFSRFDEAEKQFKEEIRVTPQSALPRVRLAQLALTVHQPDKAISFAQESVSLDPDAAGAHELLGRGLLEVGKIEEAVRELELAEGLAPTYPEVHFDLARAYAKAKRTAEAEHERAIFGQMSEVTEHQNAQRGNNAYGSPHDSSILERPVVKVGETPQ
jgi:tetratricopeptide (TPR) repeat protein